LGVPFTPFTKGEPLGRIANFTGGNQMSGGRYGNNNEYWRRNDNKPKSFNNKDEEDFELVDTAKAEKTEQQKNSTMSRFARSNRGGFVHRGGYNNSNSSNNNNNNSNNSNRGNYSRGGGNNPTETLRGEPLDDINQPQLKGKQLKYLLQGPKRGKQFKNNRGGLTQAAVNSANNQLANGLNKDSKRRFRGQSFEHVGNVGSI